MSAKKLAKSTLPNGTSKSDFKCYGPVASKDCEFEGTRIADMGCFNDKGVLSNKYYHACVCSYDDVWYTYFEWGRIGSTSNPQFQFIECSSKEEAEKAYVKQCNSKNKSRGEWKKVAGKRIFGAKKGKDCYLVQPKDSRSVGLPDGNSISTGNRAPAVKTRRKTKSLDDPTIDLLKDITQGAISFTKKSVGEIPTIDAINEVREFLDEATKITNKQNWKRSKNLRELTAATYGRIPKYVKRGEKKLLTPELISEWRNDLDSYESASGSNISLIDDGTVQLSDLNLRKLKHVPESSSKGGWIRDWMVNATANRHANLPGDLKIMGLWFIERVGDVEKIEKYQRSLKNVSSKGVDLIQYRPDRMDVFDRDEYRRTNTELMFHGTRSTNVKSIMETSFKLPKELSQSLITYAMFGSGTYMADDFKKSIGYTSKKNSYWNSGKGAIKGRGAFMFLCDTVLGSMDMPTGRTYKPAPGKNSTFARGSNHSKVNAGVENNEFIVFNTESTRIRYLVEFDI